MPSQSNQYLFEEPRPEQYVVANKLKIAYDEFGKSSDPAILLIMGLGTQMIAWPDPLCEGLADCGYRVVRFDNRDIGLSEKILVDQPVSIPKLLLASRFGLPVSVPYTLNDMATDSVGVLDGLNIEAAHIVGASMGGMIAQVLTASFPQRALSLTSIMSTSGNPKLPSASWRAAQQLLMRPADASEVALVNHGLRTWKIIGSPDYMPSEEDLRARILRSMRRSLYPLGYKHQMAAIIENGDRRSLLKQITTPTLVMHGREDVLVPVEGGIDTANSIDGATLQIFEGMGHDLPIELVPRFVRMISKHAEGSARFR